MPKRGSCSPGAHGPPPRGYDDGDEPRRDGLTGFGDYADGML